MCIVILKESTQIQVQYTASLSIADCGLEFQKFENNYSGLCLLHSIRRQVNFRVNYMLNHVTYIHPLVSTNILYFPIWSYQYC